MWLPQSTQILERKLGQIVQACVQTNPPSPIPAHTLTVSKPSLPGWGKPQVTSPRALPLAISHPTAEGELRDEQQASAHFLALDSALQRPPPPPRGKLLTPPPAPLPSSLISKTPVGRTRIYYWL